MVMDARRPKILSRLIDRLGLEPDKVVGWFKLRMDIQPVTVLDDVLKDSVIAEVEADVSSGAADCFEVPPGERWHLKAYSKDVTAGACRLFLTSGGVFFLMASTVGATIIYPGVGIVLPEGGKLKLTQGAGGDTNVKVQLIYDKEQSRGKS